MVSRWAALVLSSHYSCIHPSGRIPRGSGSTLPSSLLHLNPACLMHRKALAPRGSCSLARSFAHSIGVRCAPSSIPPLLPPSHNAAVAAAAFRCAACKLLHVSPPLTTATAPSPLLIRSFLSVRPSVVHLSHECLSISVLPRPSLSLSRIISRFSRPSHFYNARAAEQASVGRAGGSLTPVFTVNLG